MLIASLTVLITILAITVGGCNEKQNNDLSAETNKSKDIQANNENSADKQNDDQGGKSDKSQTSAANSETGTTSATALTQQQATSENKNDKVMLFDTAHGEIFDLNDSQQMGYTKMRDFIVAKGYAIETNRSLFKDGVFDDADVVVLAGPMSKLNPQEKESLTSYVEKGGNLLITVHVSYFLTELANTLGLQLSTGVLCQQSGSFEGQTKNFVADGISKHPVTDGVKGVALRGTWALQPLQGNTHNANTVVSTSADSWVDINSDDMYDVGEPRGAYGVIGVSTVGKGKVIVIGDDAVFTNFTIDMVNNRTLFENIINWFDA